MSGYIMRVLYVPADGGSHEIVEDLRLSIAGLAALRDFCETGASGAGGGYTTAQVDALLAAKQALDAELTAIAGLVSAADTVPYFTGSGAAALATLTAAARTLLAAIDAAAQRSALGLGTAALSAASDFQPVDADLTAIAGLTATTDNFIVAVASSWASRTVAQVRTTLGLLALAFKATIDSAALVADSVLTYAKIQNVSATDRLLGRSTAGAGVIEEIVLTAAGRALIDDADAAAQRTTLGLGTAATTDASAYATAAQGTDARTPTAHATSHLPGGTDALTTAAAGSSAMGDVAAAGVAASFARSDHTHGREMMASVSEQPVGTQTLPANARTEVISDNAFVIASPDVIVIPSGSLLNLLLNAEQQFASVINTIGQDTVLIPGSIVAFDDDPVVISSGVKLEVPLDTVLWTDAPRAPQFISQLLWITA